MNKKKEHDIDSLTLCAFIKEHDGNMGDVFELEDNEEYLLQILDAWFLSDETELHYDENENINSHIEYFLLLKDLPNTDIKTDLVYFANTSAKAPAMFYMFGLTNHWSVFQGGFIKESVDWFRRISEEEAQSIKTYRNLSCELN